MSKCHDLKTLNFLVEINCNTKWGTENHSSKTTKNDQILPAKSTVFMFLKSHITYPSKLVLCSIKFELGIIYKHSKQSAHCLGYPLLDYLSLNIIKAKWMLESISNICKNISYLHKRMNSTLSANILLNLKQFTNCV